METIVVIAGRQDARQRLQVAGDVLRRAMPACTADHEVGMMIMPEVLGGCLWLRPRPPYAPLATQFENGRVYVVVYGEILGASIAAEHVAARYDQSGLDGLRRLDGAYTAIVVDRRAGSLHVRTDVVGVRSLHYALVGGGLVVSPQLMGMAATGLLAPSWDLTTVASIVGVDWSVGRHSLLQGVKITQPYETVDWTAAGTTVRKTSPLDFEDRIAADDRKQMTKQCDRVVDRMTDATRRFADAQSAIRINLTDGLDSRVVLAVFAGAGARSKITAATSGVAESPDVLGAQRLAAALDVPHKRREPDPVSAAEFLEHANLLAFLDSGDGTSKRALAPLPNYRGFGASVSGNGGEIYRGNYYPVFGPLGNVPADPRKIAEIFVARLRAGRFAGIDREDRAHRRAVTRRLVEALEQYVSFGAKPADLADLLYLWERHGHWGATSFRRPWARGWSPFASPSVIREFFRLPAPLGMHNDIHARAIRRYLPLSAYLRPFNRYGWVPLQRAGTAFFLLRQLELVQKLLAKKISLTFRLGAEMQQLEQVWARMLAQEVFEVVYELLTEPASLAVQAFGAPTVAKLLNRHRVRHDLLDTISPMLSTELARKQIEQAYQQAIAAGTSSVELGY